MDKAVIDKIIESMNKRMDSIISKKGGKTKYWPFHFISSGTHEELELLKEENRHYANQLQAMKVKQGPVVTSFDYQKKWKEMSEELDMLKQANRQYANLLQTANEEKQSLITSLNLLANELRTLNLHEHVDTRLAAENRSLQETINILNADNQLLTTKVAELSNQQGLRVLKDQNQDQASDFQDRERKRKKQEAPNLPKGNKLLLIWIKNT